MSVLISAILAFEHINQMVLPCAATVVRFSAFPKAQPCTHLAEEQESTESQLLSVFL